VLRVGTGRVVRHAMPDLPDSADVHILQNDGWPARLPIGARLLEQTALPQAGLADQRDHLSLSLERLVDRAAERLHLMRATHQLSHMRVPLLRPWRARLPTQHDMGGDRLRLALDLDVAASLQVEGRAHEPGGV